MALALMIKIVMAYNAGQMQKSVDAEVAAGAHLAACLRALEHVGPVSYGHVNFRGTYFFSAWALRGAHLTGGGMNGGLGTWVTSECGHVHAAGVLQRTIQS